MKKILLLTSGLGEDAHLPASHLRAALEAVAEAEIKLEILDLFDTCYARYTFVNRALISRSTSEGSHAPVSTLPSDFAAVTAPEEISFLQVSLRNTLERFAPDVVVTLGPDYVPLLDELYPSGVERPFALLAVVSELIPTIHSPWAHSGADYFLVAQAEASAGLEAGGGAREKIVVTGLPVAPEFAPNNVPLSAPNLTLPQARPHLLYLMPGTDKKASKLLRQLLRHQDWDLTLAVGRSPEMAALAHAAAEEAPERVKILGWTHHLPRLFMGHHLVIGCPSSELLPDLAAAGCPLIAFPADAQLEYALIRQRNAGSTAHKVREVIAWIERALLEQGRLLNLWKSNLKAWGTPEGAFQIARFIMRETRNGSVDPGSKKGREELNGSIEKGDRSSRDLSLNGHYRHSPRQPKPPLLCDFHTHTTWSDGQFSVRELVDFYGQRQFDCLCVPDPLCDPRRLLGRLVNLTGLVIPPDELGEYFDAIEREKKRAWEKYDLLLLSGVEFNKDGYTPNTSAHLLGIDLKSPIDPSFDIQVLIKEIHLQGGLAVASHPNRFQSSWGKNTLYFWDNLEAYAPLLDAWEIANRNDLYNPVGLKKLPILANSDFHKPKHVYSWKTLLQCEKDPESIKQCIRSNRDVSLYLYRDDS